MQRAELKGDWTYAGDQAALENFVSRLDDTEIKGWVRAESLEQEKLVFDLQVDALDLDRYSAPAEETAEKAAKKRTIRPPDNAASTADDSQPGLGLPLEQLRTLNMEGRVAIGKLIDGGSRVKRCACQTQRAKGADSVESPQRETATAAITAAMCASMRRRISPNWGLICGLITSIWIATSNPRTRPQDAATAAMRQ